MKKGVKVLSISFWLIAAAHILAFTAIGIFTSSGWKLLLIFLACLPVALLVKMAVTKYIRRRHD